ncbi:DUF674 family protein, partial [Trifolium medium]|nr:DUF674 family protein [Trifolium medium]
MLLQPKNSGEDYCSTIKINIDDTQPTEYFICSKFETCSYRCLTTSLNKICQHCGTSLTRSVSVEPFYNGFVNEVATFVIIDDLNVIPNASGYTSIALIQNSGIKSISSMKEMTVNVTKEKVLDLLKCSLVSKSPLTDL